MPTPKRISPVIALAGALGAWMLLIASWRPGATRGVRADAASAVESATPAPLAASAQAVPAAPSSTPAPALSDEPGGASLSSLLGEAKLMEELRHARTAVLAIQLARAGNQQFPDSAFAPERESILIHALADNEQRSEARGHAEYMVNHYPDSRWVREIEQFTGAHRHRKVRLNDAGELEYF